MGRLMEEFLTEEEMEQMQYSDLDWTFHNCYDDDEEDEDESNLDGNLS